MNFSGKEGHQNIPPSTRPGIEPGTSGVGGRTRISREVWQGEGEAGICAPKDFFQFFISLTVSKLPKLFMLVT